MIGQTNLTGSSSGKADIIHDPILASELPAPGSAMQLKVKLTNTRDTERKLQALITADGRLYELAPTKSYLDEFDQPTYEFDLYSPLAEISYQFILSNPDKSHVVSDRFQLRRSCIPRIDTSGLDLEKGQGEERLHALVKTAEGLSREIATQETAQKLVDELLANLGGGK
jgi:hypothetical protein